MHAERYRERVNLLVAPCVSPWAYEVIQRWNWKAIDPNRSFVANSPCAESAALMELVRGKCARVHGGLVAVVVGVPAGCPFGFAHRLFGVHVRPRRP